MTFKTFKFRQCVADVIRVVIALTLVAYGHPYMGVFVAMIYVEMN